MSGGDLSVAVVGGGIGGLAAALSLLRAGFDVQVFEQASALVEVGAGIQISPNASRLLHRLGLGAALDRTGVRPVAVHQRRWDDGRTLQRAPLGEAVEAAFGAPYYHFHRADLLKVLADALPPHRLHLGHRLAAFTDHGDRVELRFAHGERVAAGMLVGADGIHSTVRGELFGPEQPRFTGCMAYRGLVPADLLGHLELEILANNWMGPGGHFVHYFVAGGRLVNFVAIIERETWTRESWTDRGEVADALAAFKGWHPLVGAIIGAVDETFIWALFDRAPLDHWSVGRVTLLGDACHAMLPFMAQGAAQSIEDGATLAACLLRMARPTSPPPCGDTRRFDGCGRHACRRCLGPTRRASTSPTASSSKRATPSWPRGATGRSRRSAGSTGTTLRRSTAIPKRNGGETSHRFTWRSAMSQAASSDKGSAQRADALIARMKKARGYIYPEWEFAARQDPEFVETYNRIYELGLGEGKHVSAKVREFVAIALLAFRGADRAGLVAHMERAIRLGATREELFEVLETCLVPGGAPTFHRGLGALLEVKG